MTAFRAFSIVAVAALLAACTASAATTVSDAWVRASTGMDAPVAAYVVISNESGQDDALTSASSPAASTVEIHETQSGMAGMTGMKPVGRVPIAAGSTVTFAPGGYHLMLSGLRSPLTVGQTIELDLTFEHAGRVVVQAEVRQG